MARPEIIATKAGKRKAQIDIPSGPPSSRSQRGISGINKKNPIRVRMAPIKLRR
jgi:hypothetical protein